MMQMILIFIVRGYQVTLRPFLGRHCRFHPTCSDYAIEALKKHGSWSGGRMAAFRFLRCRPCGGKGYDPVPPIKDS